MESGESWLMQDEIELQSDREIEAEIAEIISAGKEGGEVDQERLDMLKNVLHWRRFPEED